jgi:hypothetical protein
MAKGWDVVVHTVIPATSEAEMRELWCEANPGRR